MSDLYKMRLPYSNFNGLRIIGKDTATVAVVEQWAADQGHADFIVRACNSHDQLVAALKFARERLALADEPVFDARTLPIIDEALAAAGAK